MTTFGEAWAENAQREADLGKLTCRACRKIGSLDEAITIWRNGILVYGIGDCCLAKSEFLIRPTELGIEIKGRSTSPIIVGTNALPSPKRSVGS